ncbi:CDP-glycerol glycerophosphotransferase family protein [Sporosarcina sp. G11-34]|uniref:CDP-glycerol glycerophosphotransferase family protein n=1 Tax=Sporosarcina sp. G11-34 TaxID=2849605 RepID=UPI0022A96EF0|nr:CDP-glycerol glycerophosphotransferase family protein [Sporosarcina sp. G11-34]MCZ2258659.1 CDP-glycerol glycerophosphotransferase family protein [Sporosarcina sp. G11-34]
MNYEKSIVKDIYCKVKIVNHDEYNNLYDIYLDDMSNYIYLHYNTDEFEDIDQEKLSSYFIIKTFLDYLSNNQIFPNEMDLSSNDFQLLFKLLKESIGLLGYNTLHPLQRTLSRKLLLHSLISNNKELFGNVIFESEKLHVEDQKLYYGKSNNENFQNLLSINALRVFFERLTLVNNNIDITGYFRVPYFRSNGLLKNKLKLVLFEPSTSTEHVYDIQKFYRHDINNSHYENNGYVGLKMSIPLTELTEGSHDFYLRIFSEDGQTYYNQRISAATVFNRFKGYFTTSDKLFFISVNRRNHINLKVKGHYSKARKKLTRLATHFNAIFNLKKGKLKKGGLDRLAYLFTFPFLRNKNIWLISERGDTCQDNSYHLFKHIRLNYPEKPVYYIIDKKSSDYEKIKNLDNIINKDSLKHRVYLLHSQIIINAYDVEAYTKPGMYTKRQYLKIFGDILNYKTVFLQHGIIYNDVSASMSKNRIGNDLVIASLPKEKKFIESHMDYPSSEVVLTGLPRYDNLKNRNQIKRKILLMPTWRRHLSLKSYLKQDENDKIEMEKQFIESDYFNFYNSLLQSDELAALIDEYNLDFEFYPHYEIQPYLDSFQLNNEKIKVLNKEVTDIQDLLISADLLITDYSSVFFDFLAMKKPVVFCHFDYEEFYEKQYKEGYLNLRDYPLGYVTNDIDETISSIKKVIDNNFQMAENHMNKVDDLFHFDLDNQFSERVYQEILQLENKITLSQNK